MTGLYFEDFEVGAERQFGGYTFTAEAIKEFAASGRPILGVCLGMQLIMSRSEEFGRHEGLDLVPGEVRLLQPAAERRFKVPHIGWNLLDAPDGKMSAEQQWQGTVLRGLAKSSYMYFVHSYVVAPEDPSIIIAVTRYGADEYCSVFRSGNITGAQFHSELSAEDGLSIYRSFVYDN